MPALRCSNFIRGKNDLYKRLKRRININSCTMLKVSAAGIKWLKNPLIIKKRSISGIKLGAPFRFHPQIPF
jgi:hypothetical protein